MLICILTKNVITSCSVTMMLFLHLEVKPLMTLTTVLYLSCHGSDKTLQVGYANHFYRSAHKFEQICRHRLRRQNVGYSNFSQPQSHLSFCVLLQYLVERRRVVTQLGKLD